MTWRLSNSSVPLRTGRTDLLESLELNFDRNNMVKIGENVCRLETCKNVVLRQAYLTYQLLYLKYVPHIA